MDLSNIKLVASDMDGTLLNAKHELSPDFFPLFDEMRSRQVLFAAASGRQYFNLLNRFESIKDEIIFIAENGSYVVYKGDELLVQAMPNDVTMEQLTEARKIPDVFPILCGKKMAYIESQEPRFIENVEMYYDEYLLVDDLLKVENDDFLKIAICDLAGSETNSYKYFQRQQDHLQVKVSGSIWLDISHKLADKGRAIKVLHKKFGISPDDTMVFGDYLNDLEMMQSAKFSFAMENAHPDIKKASSFLAKSNNDNGVIEILHKMIHSIDDAGNS